MAQSTTGILAGNIADPSGAVVPQAVIVATGENTGIKYSAVASNVGSYRIAGIQPGVYSVTVESSGFQKYIAKGVTIQVSNVAALDIQMRIGGAQESVTVNVAAGNLETQSSDIVASITPRQVEELPLSLGGGGLRSPEAFVFLTPGVSGVGTVQGGGGGVFAQRINGGQAMGQEVLLDGASVDRSEWHTEFDETAPSVDAIKEFTIEASTIPAQYSRTAGGVVAFVTKNGTNLFHGVAYDIFQNTVLNANSWFNNGYIAQSIANGSLTPAAARNEFQRGTVKKNDFGGTVGGPIWIPKVYNGRDKSFFFFAYEKFLQPSGGTTVSTLPTSAERGGDFSALLGGPTGQINPCDGTPILKGQIFDPATTTSVGGVTCRTAFPQNMINSGRFSNVAKNTIALLPPLLNSNLTQNYAYSSSFPVSNTTWTLRGDQVLTDRQKISLSYSHRLNSQRVGLRSLPLPLDPGHQDLTFKTTYARISHQFIFSPNLLNQIVIGYNRYDSASQLPTATAGVPWANKIGISNVTGFDFPQFGFSDPQNISVLGSNVNNDSIDNGYRINDNVTWIKGRHSLDFGANASYQEYAPNNFAGGPGLYSFSTAQTAPEPNFGPQAGSAWASFLLGQVNSGSVTDRSSQSQWRSNYFAFYGQDTLKVSPTLVVNYGLNWSFETPRRELHNRTSSWSPTLPNPGADNLPGAIQFGNANNRSFISTYYKDLSPRLGFAWTPSQFNGKIAIRGGYGVYYASLFYGDTGNRTTGGFTTHPNFNSLDSFSPAFSIDNGFPKYQHAPFIQPTLDNGSGVDAYIEPGYNRPGYIQNWSAQIQQELAPDLIFSLGYVGSKGNRLRSGFRNANAIPESALRLGTVLSESITSADAQTAGVQVPFSAFETLYNPGTVSQALRKWPQVQGINTGDVLENLGMSSYHSLQAQLERKFRNGFNLLVSYTWSKTLTDSDGLLPFFAQVNGGGSVQDPYNRRAEKAVSNEDTPHTFVASYIYELPVGKNKMFLSHAPAVVNAIVGGWQVSGIQRYQSGQPVTFNCAVGIPGLDNCTRFSFSGKPVVNGKGESGKFNPFDSAHNTWLNSAAFVDPNAVRGPFIPWKYGDSPRVFSGARGQKYFSEDFSLQKNTHLTEDIYLEFRAEAFNAFNRHIFSLGDQNPTSSTFGQTFGTINGPRNLQLTLKLHY